MNWFTCNYNLGTVWSTLEIFTLIVLQPADHLLRYYCKDIEIVIFLQFGKYFEDIFAASLIRVALPKLRNAAQNFLCFPCVLRIFILPACLKVEFSGNRQRDYAVQDY